MRKVNSPKYVSKRKKESKSKKTVISTNILFQLLAQQTKEILGHRGLIEKDTFDDHNATRQDSNSLPGMTF